MTLIPEPLDEQRKKMAFVQFADNASSDMQTLI